MNDESSLLISIDLRVTGYSCRQAPAPGRLGVGPRQVQGGEALGTLSDVGIDINIDITRPVPNANLLWPDR